jgi:hypothetical protein
MKVKGDKSGWVPDQLEEVKQRSAAVLSCPEGEFSIRLNVVVSASIHANPDQVERKDPA